jgi:Ricin-type beta-trefoil lectin domain-like
VDIHKFNSDLLDKSTHLYFYGGKNDIFTRARLISGDSVGSTVPSAISLPMGSFPIQRTVPAIMTGGAYNIVPEGVAPFRQDFESISHAFLNSDYTCDVTFEVHKDKTAFVGLGLAGKAKFLALDMRPDKEGVSVALNHNEEWPHSFASIPEPGTYVARIDKVGHAVTFSVGTGEGTEFKSIASKTVGDIGTDADELTANSTHLILGGDTAYSKITITPPIVMPAHVDATPIPDPTPVIPPIDQHAVADDGSPKKSNIFDFGKPATPPDASAHVDAAASPGRKIDLLKLVDVDRDCVQGKWQLRDTALASEASSKIEFSYKPPEEYDYKIEYKRDGNDFVMQELVGDGKPFMWIMGGWGGRTCGFEPVDGHPALDNSTTRKLDIPIGQRCVSVVKVRRDDVSVFLNDKLIADFKPNFKSMDLWTGWRLRHEDTVGIYASTPTTIYAAEILEVSGRGSAVPDIAVEPAIPAPAAGTAAKAFDDWYYIINKRTGHYLFITSDNKNEGNPVSVQASNNSDNEKWMVGSLIGSDAVKLVSKYSNKIVGVREGSHKAGMDVIEWNDWKPGQSHEKGSGENWKITAVGDDFKIVSEVSGLCLTERHGGEEKAVQLAWRKSDDQLWRIEEAK